MNPIHASHPISQRFILILSPYIRLGLPSGLFPSGFPKKDFVLLSSEILRKYMKVLQKFLFAVDFYRKSKVH